MPTTWSRCRSSWRRSACGDGGPRIGRARRGRPLMTHFVTKEPVGMLAISPLRQVVPRHDGKWDEPGKAKKKQGKSPAKEILIRSLIRASRIYSRIDYRDLSA